MCLGLLEDLDKQYYYFGIPSFCIIPQTPQVRREVNNVIAQLVAWSVDLAAKGVAPDVGFYNEPFEKGTYRFSMKGRQLSSGWRNFGGTLSNCQDFNPMCFFKSGNRKIVLSLF